MISASLWTSLVRTEGSRLGRVAAAAAAAAATGSGGSGVAENSLEGAGAPDSGVANAATEDDAADTGVAAGWGIAKPADIHL